MTSHMESDGEFSFSFPFDEEKAKVLEHILEWGMGSRTKALDFSQFAAKVSMTARSVKNRRQKIMDLFGLIRPVEIVKLLVRLDDRGLH